MQRLNLLKQTWLKNEDSKKMRIQVFIAFLVLVASLALFERFVVYVEARPGTVIFDPVLALFNPIDVSMPTFILIYACTLYALYIFSFQPKKVILVFLAYVFFILFRAGAMYVTVLDPPTTIIPLSDPLVELFGSDKTLTKDLFFSGHVGLLSIFYFCSEETKNKVIFFIAASLVAVFVLLQHVHYTVDVLCAPFFSYACCRIVHFLDNRQII